MTMYQIGANYANGPIKAAVTYAIEDYSVGKDPKEGSWPRPMTSRSSNYMPLMKQ